MPKLFVALEVPPAVGVKLATLQPSPGEGIRLVDRAQMHVTLYYIGDAYVEQVSRPLRDVRGMAFEFAIEGVGQFPPAGGAVTLWAGVRKDQELLRLHEAVSTALAKEGFQPEGRPYTPHVTLARCEAAAAGLVSGFIKQHAGFSLSGVPVLEFGLYSSESVEGVPVYRRERLFPLIL